MAPTKNASAASAPFTGEELDDDSEINWLQNPHTNSITSNSDSNTVNDPTLLPLLSHLSTLDSTLTCPICHVTPLVIPVTLTPCQHTFCSLCLQSNFHSQKRAANGTNTKTSCPKCRVRCHEDRDVVPNAVLEGVCRVWKGVRGSVRDRLWSSSSASSSGGNKNDNESAASAANGADDGSNGNDGGGKKRAAASVTASSDSASASSSAASSASSSSASASTSAGGRKRPRRGSSSRRTGSTTAASAASNTASAADDINDDEDDDDEDMPSSDEDSAYSDTDDVEFVPKSGRGGGNSNRKGSGRSSASSAIGRSNKAAAAATKAKAKVAKSKSYPTDADYLTSIRSTIDPRTLDRTQSLPGNLTHVKKPKMIQMLAAYHLSTSAHATGNSSNSSGLDVLKDRYRAFRMLYNAQCPSTHPAPIAQLVEQVHAEERARDRERRMALMNGSGRVSEEMRRLNAKWNEEGKKIDGGDGGGGEVRAADIPDKMKTGFAALVAQGKRRCEKEGWRMGKKVKDASAGDGTASKKKRKWEEDEQELGPQEEEKKDDDADTADGAEEPIVLDDGSDDEDEDDDRKPSAAEAARAAEDGINGPQDSTNDAGNGDDDREAQISRSPSSESPRTVRASSSSDGLVGPISASSAPASAKKSSSAKKAKKSKPGPRQAHQQTPQPQQHHPASVDTRSIRNNSTPSTIGPWSCGACTYYNEINIGSRDKCEMCDTPRPRPSSRPSRNVGCFDC